jgi:parallel beta-helix repeat protein
MRTNGNRFSARLVAGTIAIALGAAACSPETAPETTATTDVSATTSPTGATATTSTAATTVETTIPPTSIPPVTVAPPGLGPTTTTEPEVSTTIVDDLPADVVAVAPNDDLAALVRQAAPGTHFVILPGVHRISEVAPKDGMTFEGLPGAILNGSRLLDGFEKTTDGWDVTGVDLNMEPHGECVSGYQACALRNDLYVDDQMLWRVDDRNQLAPGTWWSDGNRIVIADDPAGRKVEVSLTENAFLSDADNVTIKNLIIEKFAARAQTGAIQIRIPGDGTSGSNWLIDGVEVRLNHGSGIATGDGTVIRNVHSHDNGQEGITGTEGTNVVVESSELDHNNLRGFDWGWEAAGAKFTRTEGLVLRNLQVHDNKGPGLWADISSSDVTYENNVVYNNDGPGIFHEISYGAVITGNDVYNNGFIMTEWLWGAGILIAASSGVEVYGNTVTNNGDGIAGIQQQRADDNGTPYKLENLYVHDNTITMWHDEQTGVVQDMGDPSVFTDRNIVFENNTYIGARNKAFAWGDNNLDWEGWLATGQGSGSTISDG